MHTTKLPGGVVVDGAGVEEEVGATDGAGPPTSPPSPHPAIAAATATARVATTDQR